jgi:hypothetical protein
MSVLFIMFLTNVIRTIVVFKKGISNLLDSRLCFEFLLFLECKIKLLETELRSLSFLKRDGFFHQKFCFQTYETCFLLGTKLEKFEVGNDDVK